MHNEEIHNESANEETQDGKAPNGEISAGEAVSSGEGAAEATEATAAAGDAEASKVEEAHGIVGIRFEPCGKVYCFKSDGMGLRQGELVVVESDLGVNIGRVVVEDFTEHDVGKELKPVLRRVTEEDLQKEKDNNEFKKEAFDFCNERIMARGLAMKLLGTDMTLDRKRIIFFFSAETRIDFRELVKDLAAKFRTRIELRQVGVRDAARIAGGIGVCGRELCCRRFLTSFEPISIKMAKKQELALNTSKLSGICGRLMCCLGYEYDEKLLQEKAREKKPSEEMEAEVEAPADTETVTVAVAVDASPQELLPREASKPQEQPHRRRRRSRGRKRHHREAQLGEAAKAPESPPEPGQGAVKAESGRSAAMKEGQPEGEKHPSKPFKRRRRRRMRGKKKE